MANYLYIVTATIVASVPGDTLVESYSCTKQIPVFYVTGCCSSEAEHRATEIIKACTVYPDDTKITVDVAKHCDIKISDDLII